MLHVRAKERLEQGKLPTGSPLKSYAGKGSNATCGLCAAPISPSEIEHELEFVTADGRTVIRFHSQCESIWNEERLRLRC